MLYEVFLTDDAGFDLEDIFDYIALHDDAAKVHYVLDGIESVINSLSSSPERGAYPRELLELGVREYRQIFFKPYWLIYRIIGSIVYVQLISDGRRDMLSLLSRRLLRV